MNAICPHVFHQWQQSHGPYNRAYDPDHVLFRGCWSSGGPNGVQDVQRGSSDRRMDDTYKEDQ